jgi:hypothetical protein
MTSNPPIPLRQSEFEAELRKLVQDYGRSQESPGSYRSEKSMRCFDCMFTTASQDCYKCTYCEACSACTGCTHCRECTSVHASSYCVRSSQLSGCTYVLMSQNCYDCVFCFGCVGLVKKEFHILNRPFKRDEYFKLVAKLEAAFGLKRAT